MSSHTHTQTQKKNARGKMQKRMGGRKPMMGGIQMMIKGSSCKNARSVSSTSRYSRRSSSTAVCWGGGVWWFGSRVIMYRSGPLYVRRRGSTIDITNVPTTRPLSLTHRPRPPAAGRSAARGAPPRWPAASSRPPGRAVYVYVGVGVVMGILGVVGVNEFDSRLSCVRYTQQSDINMHGSET